MTESLERVIRLTQSRDSYGRTDGRTNEDGSSVEESTLPPYRANDPVDIPLFDMEPVAASPQTEPDEKLSADRRRTIRQREAISNGVHPLSSALGYPTWNALRLHADDARTCGNCRFRTVLEHHRRTYAKCTFGDNWPRATHGAATDVRAWWPACRDHEYGDPKLSPDAARCVPGAAS